MVDTSNNKVDGTTRTASNDTKTNAKGAPTSPVGASTDKKVGTELSEDERAEQEENEAREAGFKYADKIAKEGDEPYGIEGEEAQGSASWLVANGYAELHSIQEGVDTTNYILLTEDGKSALSTYNEEAE